MVYRIGRKRIANTHSLKHGENVVHCWARHVFINIDTENDFRAQGFQPVWKVDGVFGIGEVVHFLRNEDSMAPERHNFTRDLSILFTYVHGEVSYGIAMQLCLQPQTQLQVCSCSCRQ